MVLSLCLRNRVSRVFFKCLNNLFKVSLASKGNERVKANKPTLHHFFTNFLRLYETGGRRWGMSLFLFLTCKRKKSSVLTKGENKEELKCMTKELPYLKLAKIFKHQSWTVKNFLPQRKWLGKVQKLKKLLLFVA